jgi:hypothetical protein
LLPDEQSAWCGRQSVLFDEQWRLFTEQQSMPGKQSLLFYEPGTLFG